MPLNADDVQAVAAALQALQPMAPATIAAVALKLPTFWTAEPEVWFAQTEAQFAARDPAIVADLTKYNYVVAALDNTTATEVKALLLHPPATQKYDTLKAALIKAYGKSQATKDTELLSLNGLGDRRPSALLRHIRGLNANPATLLRAVFLAQMPPEVRRVLAASKSDLDGLAEEADLIVEAGQPGPGIVAVAAPATRPSSSRPPPDPTNSQSDLCIYHQRFGSKAKRCRNPCAWPGNAKASH